MSCWPLAGELVAGAGEPAGLQHQRDADSKVA